MEANEWIERENEMNGVTKWRKGDEWVLVVMVKNGREEGPFYICKNPLKSIPVAVLTTTIKLWWFSRNY